MKQLMRQVVCVNDTLRMGIPVGEVGVIVQYNPNLESALRYLVRFPNIDWASWCTSRDLMDIKYFNRIESNRLVQEAMIPLMLEAGMVQEVAAIENVVSYDVALFQELYPTHLVMQDDDYEENFYEDEY